MEKKITLATFKSFVRKNLSGIQIKCKTSFDGMVDCVMPTTDPAFIAAESTDLAPENTLGLNGVWLVLGSRDYFTAYDDGKLAGISVLNCCGSFIIAIEKPDGAIKRGEEKPKTFKSIKLGVSYHKRNNLTGWFVVGDKVYWCYSSGDYNLTTLRPDAVFGLTNLGSLARGNK